MSKFYMHTIDGQPAAFYGDRICFMNFYGPANPLASSLKQIRQEQAVSRAVDASELRATVFAYGYRRVSTPEANA